MRGVRIAARGTPPGGGERYRWLVVYLDRSGRDWSAQVARIEEGARVWASMCGSTCFVIDLDEFAGAVLAEEETA